MEIIGSCGLVCSECPAYIAYQTNDEELRRNTAIHWSKIYETEISPADINCTGCRAFGIKIGHCSDCPVRVCAIEKEVENCSECESYSCGTLDTFLEYIPQAREKLEELRRK